MTAMHRHHPAIPLFLTGLTVTIALVGLLVPVVSSRAHAPEPQRATTEAGAVRGVLPDPEAGLAALRSYRATLEIRTQGTVAGRPFERQTRIEQRVTSSDDDVSIEVREQGGAPTISRYVSVGPARYVLRGSGPDTSCIGTLRDPTSDMSLKPASWLPAVTRAMRMTGPGGSTDGVARFRIAADGVALEGVEEGSEGELWLTEPGGVVLKFTLNLPLPVQAGRNGVRTAQQWTYTLTDIEAIDRIVVPAGCLTVPVDLPLPPGATEVARMPGALRFAAAAPAGALFEFYAASLHALGWTPAKEEPGPEDRRFASGKKSLTVSVTTTGGVSQATVTVFDPGQAAAPPATEPPTLSSAARAGQETLPGGDRRDEGRPPTPSRDAEVSLGGELPPDVPAYPGVEEITVMQSPGAQSPLEFLSASFETSDALADVLKFYRARMRDAGWQFVSERTSDGTVMLTWRKGSRNATVAGQTEDDQTSVVIMIRGGLAPDA